MILGLFKSKLRGFRNDAHGGVSVEFVMWMPLLVGVIGLTVQTSMLFMTQSNYWSVSRDTARIVARHGMTEVEAEAYAVLQAANQTVSPVADVTIGPETVTVTLSVPATSVTHFSGFGLLSGVTIDASVTQVLEPI